MIHQVYAMWIWEWVQTGLVTDFAFDNFVYGYGQPKELVAFHNTWFSVTIMCALLSAVVQCYFAYRIWVLGKSKVLTGAIVFVRTFDSPLPWDTFSSRLLLAIDCPNVCWSHRRCFGKHESWPVPFARSHQDTIAEQLRPNRR